MKLMIEELWREVEEFEEATSQAVDPELYVGIT